MPDPSRRRATYADLEAVDPRFTAEIIDGELVASPRPGGPHAVAASFLGGELYGFNARAASERGPGGWWILDEPELHVGGAHPRDEVLVPDLAGWRRERMPGMPDAHGERLAPDWVCEVLSPSTARRDRIRKMAIYARIGVRHAWLVDPDLRTLEVYRLLDSGLLALAQGFDGDDDVRAEPFDAHALPLRRVWGEG